MHRSRARSYVIQVLIMHTTGIEDTGKRSNEVRNGKFCYALFFVPLFQLDISSMFS